MRRLGKQALEELMTASPNKFFDHVNSVVLEKYPDASQKERNKIADITKSIGMQIRNHIKGIGQEDEKDQ